MKRHDENHGIGPVIAIKLREDHPTAEDEE